MAGPTPKSALGYSDKTDCASKCAAECLKKYNASFSFFVTILNDMKHFIN